MTEPAYVDAKLVNWDEIKDASWSGLLLGNGASIAVWDGFRYPSLFEKSVADEMFAEADKALFASFRTQNFELVLAQLRTAESVCSLLAIPAKEIGDRYDSIRTALIEAVNAVHVPWSSVPNSSLRMIKTELLRYDFVYSTNYDLLVYWSVMVDGPAGLKDYFWSERFNVADTAIWDKVTKVLYLHGALHLYRLPSGETLKRNATGGDLLSVFAEGDWRGASPLFIAEGTAEDKLRAIYGSDYLSFALSQFASHRGDVVVFGQGLGESDEHLLNAMRSWEPRTIGLGLLPGNDDHILEQKIRLRKALNKHGLVFFDSTTHPLGASGLKVKP